jgi:hypothetical protein
MIEGREGRKPFNWDLARFSKTRQVCEGRTEEEGREGGERREEGGGRQLAFPKYNWDLKRFTETRKRLVQGRYIEGGGRIFPLSTLALPPPSLLPLSLQLAFPKYQWDYLVKRESTRTPSALLSSLPLLHPSSSLLCPPLLPPPPPSSLLPQIPSLHSFSFLKT